MTRLTPPTSNKSRKYCVNAIMLSKNNPAITVADLALMLEIDLSLGCKEDFRQRLQKALDAVARQAANQA
jgi:hypothetical protein